MESPVATAWAIWSAGAWETWTVGYDRLACRDLGRLTLHERYLVFLQRGVELLYLRRREIPLLQEVGDLLRAEKALTSPPIQDLVSPLRQHHGVLGRHLSPLLRPRAPTSLPAGYT